MKVIQLDGRRSDSGAMDSQERRFQNDVNAAVHEAVQAGRPLDFLDAEQVADDLMAAYGDGPDAGPEIVRSLARKYVGDLVHAALAKRGPS